MSWKSRKAKTKTRKIKAKDLRKAEYQTERVEAGLAQTPPARKVGDHFPLKQVMLLCKLCLHSKDCEIKTATVTSCESFYRKIGRQSYHTIETPPRAADLSHLVASQKLEGLHKHHVWLVKEWDAAKRAVARIEQELTRIENEIRANSPVTKCPDHLPAAEFFRSNHEKAPAKADPWKPKPVKVKKTKKVAQPKAAKVDLAEIDLMAADF